MLTRRGMLRSAGGFIAAAAFSGPAAVVSALPATQAASSRSNDITGRLARYMVEARNTDLPPKVAQDVKHRILDALSAMVSGARLKPGEMAIRYCERTVARRRRLSSPRGFGHPPSTPRWPMACSRTPTKPTTSSR